VSLQTLAGVRANLLCRLLLWDTCAVGPVLLYAVERLTRAMRKVARKTDVTDARLLPESVLDLALRCAKEQEWDLHQQPDV
jgi:hypothetical protein